MENYSANLRNENRTGLSNFSYGRYLALFFLCIPKLIYNPELIYEVDQKLFFFKYYIMLVGSELFIYKYEIAIKIALM